jgi:hypothetical protein
MIVGHVSQAASATQVLFLSTSAALVPPPKVPSAASIENARPKAALHSFLGGVQAVFVLDKDSSAAAGLALGRYCSCAFHLEGTAAFVRELPVFTRQIHVAALQREGMRLSQHTRALASF